MIRLATLTLTTGCCIPEPLLPGGLVGVAAGQPFIDNAVGNRTQTNMEAFYNFPISDNIQVTPLVQVIANPPIKRQQRHDCHHPGRFSPSVGKGGTNI